MHRGYIKIWRKTEDSGLFQLPETLALFMLLLSKATHKPIRVGSTMLERGQWSSGRIELARILKQSEQQVRTGLTRLQKLEIITIETTSHGSIYTIVNYNNYQDSEQSSNQQNNQQSTSEQPADNQQSTSEQPHNKHINTQTHKNIRTKKESKADAQLALLCACEIPEKLALQWLEIRKLKKLVLNETALEQTKSEAAKAGFTLLEAVTKCCAEGWGGFKASWLENESAKNGTPRKIPSPDNFELKDYGSGVTLL